MPLKGDPTMPSGTIRLHRVLRAKPEKVYREFHDIAVAHGGESIEGAPGLREGSLGAMHLSYVRDPDGNKLCAIYRVK